MAQVTIEFSTGLADDWGKLSACVAGALESALGLYVSPAFFNYDEKEVENPAVCVTVRVFPAGSARQRRAACAEITARLTEAFGLMPGQVAVRIVSPPQEREEQRNENSNTGHASR